VVQRTKSGKKQEGWWPYEKRVEVISSYIALGNAALVEGVTGVPSGTVRQWRTQDWWRELETQLRTEGNLELDAKLKKLVNKSIDAVMDRIENGEYVFNVRTGNVERVPARLRDVAKVASDAIDKSILLQKFTTKVEEGPKLDDHLKKLAEEFVAIVKDTANAVHERREARLQEGVGLGTQGRTEPSQGPGAEERSEIDDEGCGEGTSGGREGCGSQDGSEQRGDEHPQQSGDAAPLGESFIFPKV